MPSSPVKIQLNSDDLWTPIYGFAHTHIISNKGEVIAVSRRLTNESNSVMGRHVMPTMSKAGALRATLNGLAGQRKSFTLWKLVVSTFCPELTIDRSVTVAYKDDDPYNCCLENLLVINRAPDRSLSDEAKERLESRLAWLKRFQRSAN